VWCRVVVVVVAGVLGGCMSRREVVIGSFRMGKRSKFNLSLSAKLKRYIQGLGTSSLFRVDAS
jgi:hypothetical protein